MKRMLQKLSATDVDGDDAQPDPQRVPSFPSPTSHFSEDGRSIAISRPSLYSHQPVPRRAPFEQYYGDHMSRVHLLEELKSNRLEGVYNLSFMLLAFALFYLFVRNVVDNGFLAGPSAICVSILLRDSKLLAAFILPLPLFFVVPFLLIHLHSSAAISARAVLAAHCVVVAALFIGATATIFRMELNPLLGVLAGLVVIIVFLKMHSYVMTNLILAEETEQIRRDHSNEIRKHKHGTQRTTPTDSDSETSYTTSSTSTASKATRKRRDTDSTNDSKKEPSSTTTSTTTTTNAVQDDDDTTLHRSSSPRHTSPGVKYPWNVTVGNLAYFVIAPTLVYETGYPRSPRMRPRYIAWQMSEMLVCLVVNYVLLMQFCVPVWRESAPTDRLWWFSIKLALPCFFMWLLLFWSLFHCLLNALAELTRFADRQFYLDWWNATDLNQFWRTWNMPVHEWCIRHLYLETVSRQRLNRQAAALGTFLLSAFFHEYVCFVAFRMVRPYMFASMILQVPLVKWSTRFAGTRTGNYLMWIMLFLGQSWVPLLYCRDYLATFDTLMCRPLYSRQS